jgi:hypothetical protein
MMGLTQNVPNVLIASPTFMKLWTGVTDPNPLRGIPSDLHSGLAVYAGSVKILPVNTIGEFRLALQKFLERIK